MTVREIMIKLGFKVDDESEKKAKGAINNLQSFAKKALSAIGIGISLVKVIKLQEEFQTVNNTLKTITKEGQDQLELQNQILKAANDCRLSYSDMCNYVSDLVKTGSSLFATTDQAADFLSLANRAFKVSGATSGEIASLNNALKASFTTGRVSAGSFNTIMNASPEIIGYLSESLGISTQQVKSLGLAGAVTAKQLYAAFKNSADEINSSYANVSMTITEALTTVRNDFGLWLSQINQATGFTNFLSKIIVRTFNGFMGILKKTVGWFERLVKLFGTARRAALFLVSAVAGIVVALNWSKIVAGVQKVISAFKSFGSMLSGVNVKLLLIVAVVVLVILILEDLVAFVNGDASLIGAFFEKLGVDGEEFRKVLKQVFQVFKDLFAAVLPVLSKLISSVMPMIKKLLAAIMPILSKIVQLGVNLLVPVLKIVVSVLNLLTPILNLLIALLEPIFDVLEVLVDVVAMLIDVVVAVLTPFLDLINMALQPILEIIGWLVSAITDDLGSSFSFITDVINSIVNGPLKSFLDFISYIVEFISAVFTGDWDKAWKSLGNIPIAIINGIISGFESLINFFIKGINKITAGLSSVWTWIGIPAIPAIPEVSFGRISYLAEGGYVEKNNPTPVIIGDNTQEGEIVSPVSKMREAVLDALKVFVGGLTSAGGDGEAGESGFSSFVTGIYNRWQQLLTFVGNIKDYLASSFNIGVTNNITEEGAGKDLLGIFSERLQLLLGYVEELRDLVSASVGKDDTREAVLDALKVFVGGLTSAGGDSEAVKMVTAHTVNRSVQMNVSIYNTFSGTRDEQRSQSGAAKKTSGDITKELANALAYTGG